MASVERKRERLGSGRVGSLRTWLKPSSFFLSRDYGAVYNRALFFCYSRVDKKKRKKKKWFRPLNATDPLILNAIKNCSLSLSPDSLSRVKKWQRCWRLLLKRLIKDVQLEGNLKIFSSQVKLSFEFTNSLLQLTNNHTSTSLLSVACTGLFFSFFFRRVSWMPQW